MFTALTAFFIDTGVDLLSGVKLRRRVLEGTIFLR